MKYEIGDKLRRKQDNQIFVIVEKDAGDWYRLDNLNYLVCSDWLNRDYELVDRADVILTENEVKARELAKGRCIILTEMRQKDCSYEGDYEWEDVKHPIHKQCEQVALEMAEWKDSEFEKEKTQWIENAWNWLTEQKGERTKNDFKNAMKSRL